MGYEWAAIRRPLPVLVHRPRPASNAVSSLHPTSRGLQRRGATTKTLEGKTLGAGEGPATFSAARPKTLVVESVGRRRRKTLPTGRETFPTVKRAIQHVANGDGIRPRARRPTHKTLVTGATASRVGKPSANLAILHKPVTASRSQTPSFAALRKTHMFIRSSSV